MGRYGTLISLWYEISERLEGVIVEGSHKGLRLKCGRHILRIVVVVGFGLMDFRIRRFDAFNSHDAFLEGGEHEAGTPRLVEPYIIHKSTSLPPRLTLTDTKLGANPSGQTAVEQCPTYRCQQAAEEMDQAYESASQPSPAKRLASEICKCERWSVDESEVAKYVGGNGRCATDAVLCTVRGRSGLEQTG